MFVVKRSIHNPVINPITTHPWESEAVFNWSPISKGKTLHAFYRAMGDPVVVGDKHLALSTIGHAVSSDGAHFKDSTREQFIMPEEEWERYGCEDPRVCEFEGKYYIFYTALGTYPFSAEGIRVAVAVSDDLKKVNERHLVTPFNAKAMTLFPRRIRGKIVALLSAHTDSPPTRMSLAFFDKIEDMWDIDYWQKWHSEIDKHSVNSRRGERDQIEVGAAPVEIDEGWLVVYSHIQNYGTQDVIFGIEALLLDKGNPSKIIGHTHGPIMAPEESYEKYGHVPFITFPSGALLSKDTLQIYYGAADTTCCLAEVNVNDLVAAMKTDTKEKFVTRFMGNPIISPITDHAWENKATFNPAAIKLGNKANRKTHILYRAMGADNTSVIGYAASDDGDGCTISERLPEPIYVPRVDFESKGVPGGNSGCEDPRITEIGKRVYMCYTAYNGIKPPAVAVTSISSKDLVDKNWNWDEPVIITEERIDDKDACFLPEKVKDEYIFYHRIDGTVYADRLKSLDFKNEKVMNRLQVLAPRPGMWDCRKVGLAAPPIKTKSGWLALYHGISIHGTYRVGAVLLSLSDPTSVIARTAAPILEPVESYEKNGQVGNVVFPCGLTQEGDTLFIYYGGGDSVVAVATVSLKSLLKILTC
ncbi:MAG TPA: hypothetical protein VJB98_02705 [Candidatus Paceibacterota bacterium]